MNDIEKQSDKNIINEDNSLILQNEAGILGEMVNLSNHLDQHADEDAEKVYQQRNSVIYNVPVERDEDNESLEVQPSINSSEADSVHAFTGNHEDGQSTIDKIDSNSSNDTLQKIQTRYFSPRLQNQRKKVFLQFLLTILIFAVFMFTIFTLFWGSNAFTVKYYPRIKLLAVFQDDILTTEMEDLNVIPLTAVMGQLISLMPGKWSIYNTSDEFINKYNLASDNTNKSFVIDEKVTERIYHEYFWVSLNIKPNATLQLYNSIVNNTATPFNSSSIFEVMYESGRDPTNMKTAILPIMQNLDTAFEEYYSYNYLPSLITNITTKYPNITFNPFNVATMGKIGFNYIDYRPFYRRGLITPAQIGIIYGLIITVFQFLVYTPLHMEMAKYLNAKNYIIYRILISFITFFFTSLFYCTVSAMYGFDFTKAFGRGGFMVYWMSSWLYMLACGGANENVVSLIFLWKPQFLGFWILSFVIINLGPAFFPMALDNVFYRYGYAMPIHNAVGIFRVIFMDTSRRHMGRNYGVLVAWIVINTILQPFVIRFVAKVNRKRQQAAVAAAAAPTEDQNKEDSNK
ncbi:similar to Saccharomyces cerevisiae YGR197C SNG1 Protein involved in resistance to nitrosoguanidine (MNNG) and 6-azauracil (6-AU) [Maudiozyma saulgeensis]|uniref:Similar to Saccharomyces cerevisiae YGR197C SNG1 Protein involved in resistance to nitrosoguanidine (MNNG) and 6-azauracil (6-AU) n=1 Tax=Maudiozyma saulgeensis TaxID=1789683 RepID=A0A1X7QWC9_9SACH|nr:similar to Saccharomyces cerevisiae YGR197C SNG1 Protein involved in resistance to nitrosoguanidine (MNNG) and 6-azauracil (6-AU) [Kazachstania saulgeensis]